LAAILLPALARARESARRSSCQNNLKQWGLIFKMYSGENKDRYPCVSWAEINTDMVMGPDGPAIYPEYWTDPGIAVCPSDAFSKWLSDAQQYFDGIKKSAELASMDPKAALCLRALLSSLPSYCYWPYAVKTASQLMDSGFSVFAVKYNLDPDHQIVGLGHGKLAQVAEAIPVGCPETVRYTTLYGVPAQVVSGDLNSVGQAGYGPTGAYLDDDGGPLPSSYLAIREGIERFMITDINDPAASARAQSELPVMWDTWAGYNDFFPAGAEPGLQTFNHIPGGSNVLYMDGHSEFIRYPTAFPVANSPAGTYGEDLYRWMGHFSGML
jgi:prepilin-type processing-associated H-X9-DG protein